MNTQPVARPIEGRDLAKKITPFGVPALAGFLVALLPSGTPKSVELLAAAGILLMLCALVVGFAPWSRLPRRFVVLVPLAYIGVVALMRASVGAPTSTYAPLLLLPLVWLALYGSRHELIAGLAAAATVLLLTGTSNDQGLQHALVAVAVTPIVCLTIQRLVTKVRRQAAILEDLAHGDHLTGAANRSGWESMLDREIIRAARTGEPVTIGLIDFDDFETFNERFGPEAGDDVLRQSVAAWRRELRGGDLLGRVESDGFGVALPACGADQAQEVFDRLRVATTGLQTCSIGIAESKSGESTVNFVARATAALLAAQQAGGDRMVVAEEPITSAVSDVGGRESSESLEASPMEQALAESRSLFAELHDVADGPEFDFVDKPDDAGKSTGDEDGSDGVPPNQGAGDEALVRPQEEWTGAPRLDEDTTGEDDPALALLRGSANCYTVHGAFEDAGAEDLLATRSASEIHKVLRDLSSTH